MFRGFTFYYSSSWYRTRALIFYWDFCFAFLHLFAIFLGEMFALCLHRDVLVTFILYKIPQIFSNSAAFKQMRAFTKRVSAHYLYGKDNSLSQKEFLRFRIFEKKQKKKKKQWSGIF